MTDQDSLLARRERALGAGAPLFYRQPLELVRGDGVHLFDPDGRRFVDMYNNVPCVGHANPRVVEAMVHQQGTLNVHSRYLHDGIVTLAERLTALHRPAPGDPSIDSVVFSCSGTEAVEVALRMARLATGRRGVIGTDATYHGNSEAVGALTWARTQPDAYPDVRLIPFPQRYRPLTGPAGETLSEAELADAYLARLEQAIASLEAAGTGLAAVVFCSILANEGLPEVPAGFMARAGELVRGAGGLVIADEVQAGYGRTGRWWGYEVSGLVPDIVVTGKPMGNGLPLSATAARQELVDRFRAETRHFNTFAASPLQAAVGLAVLDEIEQRDLLSQVASVGVGLKAALTERAVGRPWMGDVRGHGLFLGMEVVTDDESRTPDKERAIEVVNRLKDRGFLTSNAGALANVVKIRPPLVFGHDDAREFLDAFDQVLAELDGG